MTILIKLGGSLITDKASARAFRPAIARQLARQLTRIHEAGRDSRIVIGHGSGSFGHYEARKQGTAEGVRTPSQRLGFARVGFAAAELSLLLLHELLEARLPAMRIQPSSSLVASDGAILSFDARALSRALDMGMIPLVHGDIALDEKRGGTIVSTETLFAHLVAPLGVRKIILLGEVEGVLDESGALIPLITPSALGSLDATLKGASGVDVTGGMLQKVGTMASLAQAHPSLRVIIADGRRDGILVDLLEDERRAGTLIRADAAPSAP